MRLEETELTKVESDAILDWLKCAQADRFIRILLDHRDKLMVAAADAQLNAQMQAGIVNPCTEFQQNYLRACQFQTTASLLESFRSRPTELISVNFVATAHEGPFYLHPPTQ